MFLTDPVSYSQNQAMNPRGQTLKVPTNFSFNLSSRLTSLSKLPRLDVYVSFHIIPVYLCVSEDLVSVFQENKKETEVTDTN